MNIFKKKLKIILIAAAVSFLLVGGLVLWAGVKVTKYVASELQSPAVQNQVVELSKKGQAATQNIQLLPCWNKAQSLMTVEPWLMYEPLQNLKNLKAACFGAAAESKTNNAKGDAV